MTRLPSIARGLGIDRRGIALAVCLLCAPVARAAPEYTFHEIVIPGGTMAGVSDINNHGMVSGAIYADGGSLGFVYSFPAGTSALYSAGSATWPGSINDRGDVVGSYSEDSGATWTSFSRAADGTTTSLPHPFLPGASWYLWGGNNAGSTVGSIWDTSRSTWVGVIQTGGVYRTVTLGKPEEHLMGINDSGWFVGYYHNPGVHYDGCAWIFRPDGTLATELMWDPDRPLDNEMHAYDINNNNVVVGTVFRMRDSITQGWIREADGSVFPISFPGSEDTRVLGINDSGDIVGRYVGHDSQWHYFVGTPVPEPGTAVLLLAGLVAARRFGLRRTGRRGHDARP